MRPGRSASFQALNFVPCSYTLHTCPFGTTHLNRDRARRGTASAMVRGEGHFSGPKTDFIGRERKSRRRSGSPIVTNYGRLSPPRPSGADREMVSKGPAKPWRGLARERFWLTGKESKNICIQAERWINNRMRFLYICQNRGRPGSMLRRFDNTRWNSPGRSALQQCYFRLGERYEQYNMVGRCYRDHPCNSRILWVPARTAQSSVAQDFRSVLAIAV